MKKIYMTPSVRVHRLRVESQILAGTVDNVNGAQKAINELKVQNLDLTNLEYKEEDPFIEVE